MATRKWKDKLSITWKGWRINILSVFDDVLQEKCSITEKQQIRQVSDENRYIFSKNKWQAFCEAGEEKSINGFSPYSFISS